MAMEQTALYASSLKSLRPPPYFGAAGTSHQAMLKFAEHVEILSKGFCKISAPASWTVGPWL
jgi:hypothetical protein